MSIALLLNDGQRFTSPSTQPPFRLRADEILVHAGLFPQRCCFGQTILRCGDVAGGLQERDTHPPISEESPCLISAVPAH